MESPVILHLETSTRTCSVALSRAGKLLANKTVHDENYRHGEVLTLFVEEVLEKAQLSMKDLDAISVASGPGSYTGLRIGVSTAKGLCYALDIPLIAIDSLTSLRKWQVENYDKNMPICAMIDARRMEVFSAIFDAEGNMIKSISADVLDEESYREYEPFLVVGDGAEKMLQPWSDRNVHFNMELHASACGQVQLSLDKFKKKEFEDVAYFEPFYLKDYLAIKPKDKKIR